MQPEEFTALTKEAAQKLMTIKGECRGMGIKSDWEVILQTKGKEGLARLEAKMAELGFPIKYNEIKTMAFYPIGYDVLSMLAMRDVFSFTEEDFEKLGRTTLKFSFFTKILTQYLISFKLCLEQMPRVYRHFYTVGNLWIAEASEKDKRVIVGLKSLDLHPIFCAVTRGFIAGALELVTRSPVSCQETKCAFQGDEYHEFLIKW